MWCFIIYKAPLPSMISFNLLSFVLFIYQVSPTGRNIVIKQPNSVVPRFPLSQGIGTRTGSCALGKACGTGRRAWAEGYRELFLKTCPITYKLNIWASHLTFLSFIFPVGKMEVTNLLHRAAVKVKWHDRYEALRTAARMINTSQLLFSQLNIFQLVH